MTPTSRSRGLRRQTYTTTSCRDGTKPASGDLRTELGGRTETSAFPSACPQYEEPLLFKFSEMFTPDCIVTAIQVQEPSHSKSPTGKPLYVTSTSRRSMQRTDQSISRTRLLLLPK